MATLLGKAKQGEGTRAAGAGGAMFSCRLPGIPVAQGRPRFTARNGQVRTFDPDKSREWKRQVALAMRAARGAEPMLTGPLELTVIGYWPLPKRERRMGRWRTKRPDLSNVLKGIEDAGNGVWYADDGQLARIVCEKHDTLGPTCLLVEVRCL